MTPEQHARLAEADRLGDLAAGMVDVAGYLAIAVHDEDRDEAGRIIRRIAGGQPLPEPITALLTVMAGMLPIDDMSAADMLAWVRWDEHGQPLGPVKHLSLVTPARRFRKTIYLQPCGTYAAYKRHLDRGEPVDEECRGAARDYWNGRAAGRPHRVLAPCGTYAAYKRHKRRGEPVDEACAEALRVYSRDSKRQERAS